MMGFPSARVGGINSGGARERGERSASVGGKFCWSICARGARWICTVVSVDNEGSDGSFRVRDRAVSSFLLRAREVGRFECLDRGCMCHVRRRSGRGICGKGGEEKDVVVVQGEGGK